MSGGIALDALLAQTRQNVAAAAPVPPAASPAPAPAGAGLAGLLGTAAASASPASAGALAGLLGGAAAASDQHAAAALAAQVSNPAERGAVAPPAPPATLAADLAAPTDPTYADARERAASERERKITTLYIDCAPEGAHVVYASDIVREATAELAAGGMLHWRCVDFGKGAGLLAQAVARRIRHADRVVLWTSSDGERACLDAFIAAAENIVRGRP